MSHDHSYDHAYDTHAGESQVRDASLAIGDGQGKSIPPVNWQLPALACLLATVTFLAGERIPFNNGLGWDGAIYAQWARDFHREAFETGIDAYRIQRILPAAITHYSLRALGMTLSDKHIINCFAAINIISITLAAMFWVRIADRLSISARGKWLGFTALFLNYAVLKNTSFNPVLTDMPAYAVSAGMVWAYLAQRQLALFVLTAIGAFVWPTLIYIGAILILFPRDPARDERASPAPFHLNLIGAGLFTLYIGLGIYYVLDRLSGPVFGFLEPIGPVIRLSMAVALAYVFFGSRLLLNNAALFDFRRWLSWSRLGTLVALVAMVVVIKVFQAALTDRPGYMAFSVYVLIVGVGAVAKPGVSFVAHIAYFGPWLLLAAMLWRPICRIIHQHGVGLTLAVLAGFLHGLDSESRHEIYLIPMLAPLFVKATEALRWKTSSYVIVAAVSVFASKIWLNIDGIFLDNAFLYPDQLYWMHHGPFMGTAMYLAHLAGAIGAGILFYVVCFQTRDSLCVEQPGRAMTLAQAPALPDYTNKVTNSDAPFRSAFATREA
ncbi:MAG: hypothetical protein WD894_04550 [Pirellulales bacterium]